MLASVKTWKTKKKIIVGVVGVFVLSGVVNSLGGGGGGGGGDGFEGIPDELQASYGGYQCFFTVSQGMAFEINSKTVVDKVNKVKYKIKSYEKFGVPKKWDFKKEPFSGYDDWRTYGPRIQIGSDSLVRVKGAKDGVPEKEISFIIHLIQNFKKADSNSAIRVLEVQYDGNVHSNVGAEYIDTPDNIRYRSEYGVPKAISMSDGIFKSFSGDDTTKSAYVCKNSHNKKVKNSNSDGESRADCLEAARAMLDALEYQNGGKNQNFTNTYNQMVSQCPKK